jgi:nucleotide-binding universal stress UspA family protein
MQVKRILVPVDGSELTDKAIEASVGLAGQLGATIVGFVAVLTSSWLPRSRQNGVELPPDDADEDTGATGPVLLRFEAMCRAAGVPFEGVLDEVPSVDKAIIAAATAHRCDMIVMVTHGRGAFGEFLFGSQTKAVLAGSTLPLLVLH